MHREKLQVRDILEEAVLNNITGVSTDADCSSGAAASLRKKWLEETEEALDDLQASLVEINFVCTDGPWAARKGVPGRVQWILHKTQELRQAVQVLSAFDGQRAGSLDYAALNVELDACWHEATRLLEHFCQLSSTKKEDLKDVGGVMGYLCNFVTSRSWRSDCTGFDARAVS